MAVKEDHLVISGVFHAVRRRIEAVLVLSIFLLLGVGSWAEAQAQGRMSDEELVRSLDDQERAAALKRDVAALERLWSDELTVNAPNNEVVIGKRAVMVKFVHAGVINFSSFERQIEFMRVKSGVLCNSPSVG